MSIYISLQSENFYLVEHSWKNYLQTVSDRLMINLILCSCLFTVCSLFLRLSGTVIMLGKQEVSWVDIFQAHTHTALPVLLLRITSVLAASPLSSMSLSCLARISVFHMKENRSARFHTTKFSFLLSGSGAGDILSDGVWTVLLILQANVAGPVHTGRYAVC